MEMRWQAVANGRRELIATMSVVNEANLPAEDYGEFRETLQERIRVGEAWLGAEVKLATGYGASHELVPMSFHTISKTGPENKKEKLKTDADKKEAAEEDESTTGADKEEQEGPDGREEPEEETADGASERREEGGGEGQGIAAHAAYLKKCLQDVQYLPMESKDVHSLSHLEDGVDRLATATTMATLEEVTGLVTQSKVLIDQLIRGIQIATSDLRKAVNRDAAEYKRKLEADKKKIEEDRLKAQKAEEAAHQRKLMSMKVAGTFKLPLADIGHPAITIYSDTKSWLAAQTNLEEFVSKPSLLKSAEVFKKCFNGNFDAAKDTCPEAKLKFALERWGKAFPQSEEAQRTHKVVAPVLESMGGDFCLNGFKSLFPGHLASTHPGFTAMTGKVFLYGALKNSVLLGHEPHFLATLRAQHSGMAQILLMSATDAQTFARDVCNKGGDLTWESFSHVLKNISESDAKACIERKIRIWHATLEPGMVLFCPPGFTLGIASSGQSEEQQTALKFALLPNGAFKGQQDMLSAVEAFHPSAADRKVIGTLQDVLALAAAVATARAVST
jgi:hypothetical protein